MGIKYTGTPKGLEAFLVRPMNKINNNEAYKQFVKADALRITNHFRESIKHYLSSILIDRKNYRAYYGLGISYKAEYEYEKAVDMFEKSSKDLQIKLADYIIEEAKNRGAILNFNNKEDFNYVWKRWQDKDEKTFEAMEYFKIIDFDTKKQLSLEVIEFIRNYQEKLK